MLTLSHNSRKKKTLGLGFAYAFLWPTHCYHTILDKACLRQQTGKFSFLTTVPLFQEPIWGVKSQTAVGKG